MTLSFFSRIRSCSFTLESEYDIIDLSKQSRSLNCILDDRADTINLCLLFVVDQCNPILNKSIDTAHDVQLDQII